uniref:Uncharacterized protein AlNc14C23G2358 n=1 Tax=Albugo laibachii Nc14 TaxID=890382 RepID=F0W659_9STRA|nr:conserved hypothetical protein [Albugo laibachii Nc14]|eukprot:CCA16601.1 conserved hypothetical protein [Albugo laibachii Nc14]
MGSYLTIQNDTSEDYRCKVSADEMGVGIASVVTAVVAGMAAMIGVVGFASFISTRFIGGAAVSVFGVSASTLAVTHQTASLLATIIGGVGATSTFTLVVLKAFTDQASVSSHILIRSMERYRYRKMTLSLWRQATCVRSEILNTTTVHIVTVVMRPLFTGPTINSNNNYRIRKWIDKKSYKVQYIVAKSVNATAPIPIPPPAAPIAPPAAVVGSLGSLGARGISGRL